jgi:hypothetical protein
MLEDGMKKLDAKKLVGLTAVAALATGSFAIAQTAATTWLDPNEVIRNLESAGYTDVHDLERDDGIYEAEATNASGQRVDLDIDPATGNVLREEPDNDDDDDDND